MAKDGELRKGRGKKRERREKVKAVEDIEVVDSISVAKIEGRKRKKKEKAILAEAVDTIALADVAKKRRRKGKMEKGSNVEAGNAVSTGSVGLVGNVISRTKDKMASRKKKRKGKNIDAALVGADDETSKHGHLSNVDEIISGTEQIRDEPKNSQGKKKKKKNRNEASPGRGQEVKQKGGVANDDDDDVLYMSSGDEDSSTGMKKWLTEYRDQRPGFEILQQRIDDFITAHEEKLEQERKEREARIAEDGWTVVGQHKGRKKTTDAESGIVVGSVAQAAVQDKLAKKKQSGVGPDFYRFQKREAQRNQVIMLQNKFEEDKKRIQQLRAARKFRPY